MIPYTEALEATLSRMANGGVFLNVAGAKPNTMTIGWGWIGYSWVKPVFVTVVRPQRHTYPLLVSAGEFTVSVPTINPLREQLAMAGSLSGAQIDKFDGRGITAAKATRVAAPIVAECGLHFECKVLLTQDMTPDRMDERVLRTAYPARDMHTLFFGEILACYYSFEA